jgi:hypothetical protein
VFRSCPELINNCDIRIKELIGEIGSKSAKKNCNMNESLVICLQFRGRKREKVVTSASVFLTISMQESEKNKNKLTKMELRGSLRNEHNGLI